MHLKHSWFCNAMFVLVTGFLAAILFPDRPSKFEYDLLDEHVMAKHVLLYRHRDPMRMIVEKDDIPDMLKLGPTTDAFEKNEARSFVDGQILRYYGKPTEADAIKFFTQLQSRMFTPMQATMMLMGCYGYVYHDGLHTVANTRSTYDYLQEPRIWKDYTTAFLLQALETRNSISLTHDRSGCSCMKDFASPTLVKLDDDQLPLSKQVKSLAQDTCTVQNTIDYALNGNPQNVVSGKDASVLRKSVMFEAMTVADNSNRQRLDPLAKTIADAKTKQTGNVDLDQQEFIRQYCTIVLDCPSTWKAADLKDITSANFYDELTSRVSSVKPHNKLRPPQICTGASGTGKACVNDLTHLERPSVSYATYNAYVQKYREAFHMCSRAGVPQYTTLKLGSMRPHRVYNVGQCFLFLAALFAFTWSYMIAHYIARFKSDNIASNSTPVLENTKNRLVVESTTYKYFHYFGSFSVVLSWIWLLIALVRGWYWYGSTDFDNKQESQYTHTTDQTSGFFFVFFYCIFGSFMFLFIYLYFKFFELSREDLSKIYERAKGGMTSLQTKSPAYAQIISNNTLEGLAANVIQDYNEAIITHLQGMAPYAQVALDLTVIAGLTVLAVATVAQRGVQDINVMSAVCVWFLAIGLFAHLSNMLRLLHVYLQWEGTAFFNTHVQKAAHHRVYLALLLAAMLFIFTLLAGLDSGTTMHSSHTLNHQLLFAVAGLFVLCGNDVLEHVAGAFETKTSANVDVDAKATTERFWLHLSTKNYYVAWIVLICILLLHMHRAMGICEAGKGKFNTIDCILMSKY